MSIFSPINYFGNRANQLNDIFSLIDIKKSAGPFNTFYDLFAGSGSISIAAMEKQIAKKYIINDAFAPFSHFWTMVQEKPSELISIYHRLLQNYKSQDMKGQEIYYNQVQNRFNAALTLPQITPLQAAGFAFLLNHAEHGMPFLKTDGKVIQLCCQPITSSLELECDSEFAVRVYALNGLFNMSNVEFAANDFSIYQDKIFENDFVLLDPPYPNAEDANENPEKHLYFRPESNQHLQEKIHLFTQNMALNGVPSLLFYAVLGLANDHPLKLQNMQRLWRLSEGHDSPFKDYVENIYISFDSKQTPLPRRILHSCEELERRFQGKNYDEIALLIKQKLPEK